MIICDSEEFFVDASWLSQEVRSPRPLADELVAQEKQMIESALTDTRGRVSVLGAPRLSSACTLPRWIPKLGRSRSIRAVSRWLSGDIS